MIKQLVAVPQIDTLQNLEFSYSRLEENELLHFLLLENQWLAFKFS